MDVGKKEKFSRENLLRGPLYHIISVYITKGICVAMSGFRDFSAAPTCYCNKTLSCLLFRATVGKPRPINLWFNAAAGEATPMNLWSSPLTEFSKRMWRFLRKSHSWVNLTPFAHHIGYHMSSLLSLWVAAPFSWLMPAKCLVLVLIND